MKQFFIFSMLIGSVFSVAFSQQNLYTNQLSWQQQPILHTVQDANKTADAVYLQDNVIVEYVFTERDAYMYLSYYKLIKALNDKGIEMYNKFYVPIYNNSEVLNLKARAILPNGKVVDVPQNKIKETTEEGRKYKLFAVEGLEKNAEIEYSYTLKKFPVFFGTEMIQSTRVPIENASVTIICPEHLLFEAKGFNGITPSKDTVIEKKRYITATAKNVKDLSDAKYALTDPYLMRIDYKLSYNLSKNDDVELYTWKEFAKKVYANYTTIGDKEKKYLDKIIKAMNIEINTDEKTICKIEDYIKSNFNIDKELVGDNGMDIEKIYATKNASDDGIARLFVNIFEAYGIKYQLVFPSQRNDLPLDEELENWNRVEKTLIYFPQTSKYITPTNITFRYPFIPAYEAATRGLFLKGTSIGSLKTAVGTFNDIAIEPFEKHNMNLEADVNFDADFDSVTISSKQILTGYGAIDYRPIYVFLPKEKQDDATKEIIKNVGKSAHVVDFKVENTALNNLNDNKPLIISGTIRSGEVVEKAGNKILFKVGEIIGPQAELYQEKPRTLPVDMPYPHTLYRTIKVNIPNGYVVKNASDLNLNVAFKKDEQNTCAFISTYTLNGNVLTVTVNEFYKEVHYPVGDYEKFKNVINAAADFNKIVLVLEKK